VNGVKRMPRWPLFVIAAPAAVAVWSGWVSLGGLCGFGVVHPLPGIVDGFTINTAITLPVGVEAYGAYALGAWLTPSTSRRARRFAKWSAIGSLVLGMMGQVAYHLLAAGHAARAPWPVVTLVSCLPVVALALGTALAHLLREPGEHPTTTDIPAPESTPWTAADTVVGVALQDVPGGVLVDASSDALVDVPASTVPIVPVAVPRTVQAGRGRGCAPVGKAKSPERVFAAEINRGELPSLRQIKERVHVGTDRARVIRDQFAAMLQEAPEAA
jgi:hypothetical protein